MAQAAPDPKYQRYWHQLHGPEDISEIKLHRMLRDMPVDNIRDPQIEAGARLVRAAVYTRLGWARDAVRELRIAAQFAVAGSETQAAALVDLGLTLIATDDVVAGADAIRRAIQIGAADPLHRAALAHAEHQLGRCDLAQEAFAEGCDLLNFEDAAAVFKFAETAAAIDLPREATELLATFFRLRDGLPRGNDEAADIVRARSEEDLAGLRITPALGALIDEIRAGRTPIDEIAPIDAETEARLREAEEDVRAGRVSGPFESGAEVLRHVVGHGRAHPDH